MPGTELVRDFVNTRELLDGTEELTSPEALSGWLEAHGVASAVTATAEDLRRAIVLREALRQALLANNGVEVNRERAFGILDEAARRGRVELHFAAGEGELSPASPGLDGALGQIAIAVYSAMGDGSWERLKACRASDCEWAFIDTARNHSRAWCSMSSCGNREKARAFRERARTTDHG